MNAKKIFLPVLALAAAGLVWTQASHSFDLGGFLKDLEKGPQQQPPAKEPSKLSPEQQPKAPAPPPAPAQKQPAEPQPSKQEGGGGLIGLGESLGVFDKKTSKILKQGTRAMKAFQPIEFEEEKAIGGSLAVEVFNRYGGPFDDPKLSRYINLVGRAVADVSNRPDIDYYFAVLNTEEANAFATPGGYVFVSVGLLRMVRNEAQLAGILGHEIAHITQKHALKTLQRSRTLEGLSGLTLAAMDKNPALLDKIIDQVSETLFTRGLDKNLEYEADKLGMEYAYRLGYFPGGLKNFLRILGKAQSRHASIFFSTHPGPLDRFKRLNVQMKKYRSAQLYPVLSRRFQSTVKGKL